MKSEQLRDIAANAVGLDAGVLMYEAFAQDASYEREDGAAFLAERGAYAFLGFITMLAAGTFRKTANAWGRSAEAMYNLQHDVFDGQPEWSVYARIGIDVASSVTLDLAKITGEFFLAGALGFVPGWLALIGLHILINGINNTPHVLSGRRSLGTYD